MTRKLGHAVGGENRSAIIIGAGPTGLTVVYELLDKTDIKPVISRRAVTSAASAASARLLEYDTY